MKLIWTGSDVLFATRFCGGKKFPTKKSKYLYFFALMIYAKISDFFIECHYVVSEHLIHELRHLKLKKDIKILIDPPLTFDKFTKKKHEGINILYYRGIRANRIFGDWVYGYDIINQIEIRIKILGLNAKIIEVNGNDDMSKIYPIIDFMVRPNRHDGCPRMVMECKSLNIPYYWSKESPDINEIIKQISAI